MDDKEFWRLISASRAEANGDPADQADYLARDLTGRCGEDIVYFDSHLRRAVGEAFSTRMWEAVDLALGGADHATFERFRYWLAARGWADWWRVVHDPDMLVALKGLGTRDELRAEVGRAASLAEVAPRAWQATGGASYPYRETPETSPDDEMGNHPPFDEADLAGRRQRWPRIAARFDPGSIWPHHDDVDAGAAAGGEERVSQG